MLCVALNSAMLSVRQLFFFIVVFVLFVANATGMYRLSYVAKMINNLTVVHWWMMRMIHDLHCYTDLQKNIFVYR